MCRAFPGDPTEVATYFIQRARVLLESGQPLAALQDYLGACQVGVARVAHGSAHTCSVKSGLGSPASHISDRRFV